MFEATIQDGNIFKKIIEAIKDLVADVNIDVSDDGLYMQALDTSHVALVSLAMSSDGFDNYRCDKRLTIGLSITNLSKVLRLLNQDDSVTLRCDDDPSFMTIIFESTKIDKKVEFRLNLLTLETEHMGIPDYSYSQELSMNSADF